MKRPNTSEKVAVAVYRRILTAANTCASNHAVRIVEHKNDRDMPSKLPAARSSASTVCCGTAMQTFFLGYSTFRITEKKAYSFLFVKLIL
jgi:hypothetical protein